MLHGLKRYHGLVHRCERGLDFGRLFEDFHDFFEVIFGYPSGCRLLLVKLFQEDVVFICHVILTTGAFLDGLRKTYVGGWLHIR